MDAAERIAVFARSKANFADAHIFIARRRGGVWSKPEPIGFTDPRYRDSDPWLTADGRWLYFISDRPAPAAATKDLDIWRSRRVTGGWSVPEHLGAEVNGPDFELGPELHGGVLTFAAVRLGGKGGLDIYAARQDGEGFTQAAPIGGRFNSTQNESDFTISDDGRTALFWRGEKKTAKLMIARRGVGGWSEPVTLPDSINVGPFNFTPSFSHDGKTIRFASTRTRAGQDEGMADIFIALLPTMPK